MNLFRWESLPAPEPAARGMGRRTVVLKEVKELAHISSTEAFLVFEGQLEESCLQVAGQQQKVVGIDQAFLWIGAQKILGVADDELVER